MSFFRNLRTSITRGRSSSRDTTPVRSSLPGSAISSLNSGSSKRLDSIESHSDSLLNRSDTFILDNPDVTPSHSNCSTLEKKSKKSKVLEKFSTFTKRKKNPPSNSAAFEHHPSDNATNTYYKWQAECGGNSLDYDSQNDPFNFLYEQQSSLKSLHNAGDASKPTSSSCSSSFDSSTYRKSKMPTTDLKKQLKVLRDQDFSNPKNNVNCKVKDEREPKKEAVGEEDEDEFKAEKYKTVTLNSFRRSFKEKFLQQQKEAAHNPAWFVEVETPEISKNKQDQRDSSKENRRDLLVFENEYYKPGSRSPIRDSNSRKELRSSTRSPVKRNETFKVERLSRFDQQVNKTKPEENTASIHIEFKNSITPHMRGRLVPVGIAKPMPSQLTYTNYYRKLEPTAAHSNTETSRGTTTTRFINHSPIRSHWPKPQSPTRTVNSNPNRVERHQTLVQIKNEKLQQDSPTTVRSSRLSTRIQIPAHAPSNLDEKESLISHSPSFGKRYNVPQFNGNSGTKKAQPLKKTYFGDNTHTARFTQMPSNFSSSTSGLRARQQAGTSNYPAYKYYRPPLFASASSLTAPASATTSSPTTPSHSVTNIYSSSSNNKSSYLKPYQQKQQQQLQLPSQQQQQTRFQVAGQRRSRSPIKVPWR